MAHKELAAEEAAQEGLVPAAAAVPAAGNLFGAQSPKAVVAQATSVARALARVLESRRLYSEIHGRRFVRVEGWTLLGSMLGVFPRVVWTRRIEQGWEARVEVVTLGGQVVGAAEAQCTRLESSWQGRDEFALRAMAQTRATSRAMRLPLGFVPILAGYEATPAEEITAEMLEDRPAPRPRSRGGRSGREERAPAEDHEAEAEARGLLRWLEEHGDRSWFPAKVQAHAQRFGWPKTRDALKARVAQLQGTEGAVEAEAEIEVPGEVEA